MESEEVMAVNPSGEKGAVLETALLLL